MRAHEFITEHSIPLTKSNMGASGGAMNTFPKQNINAGDAHLNWRMGIAMAGAPDYPMDRETLTNGDPVFHAYTDVDQDIINYAAKQVRDPSKIQLSSGKSKEPEDTHHISPVRVTRDYRKTKKA